MSHGRLATLTSVIQQQDKGVMDISKNGAVRSFREKKISDGMPINVGYMVLNRKVFDYIEGDDTSFETTPLAKLAEEGELMSYEHKGFWQCMDTKLQMVLLEKMIAKGDAPWMVWR